MFCKMVLKRSERKINLRPWNYILPWDYMKYLVLLLKKTNLLDFCWNKTNSLQSNNISLIPPFTYAWTMQTCLNCVLVSCVSLTLFISHRRAKNWPLRVPYCQFVTHCKPGLMYNPLTIHSDNNSIHHGISCIIFMFTYNIYNTAWTLLKEIFGQKVNEKFPKKLPE